MYGLFPTHHRSVAVHGRVATSGGRPTTSGRVATKSEHPEKFSGLLKKLKWRSQLLCNVPYIQIN
jgi:hypothetical protein